MHAHTCASAHKECNEDEGRRWACRRKKTESDDDDGDGDDNVHLYLTQSLHAIIACSVCSENGKIMTREKLKFKKIMS